MSRRAAINACTDSGTSTLLAEPAAVREQPHELLRVQRVPACLLQQRLLRLGREHRLLEQRGDELRGLRVAQRSEVDPLRVASVGAEGRMLLVQLRPRRAQEQQRHALGPVGQVLEKGEQRRVGPVQILEHEHRRALGREALAEAPPGRKRLLLRGRLRRRPDQRRQAGQQPGPVRVALRNRLLELRRRLRGRVRFEDAALGLDDLPQRPERDPVPVGQAAALPPPDQARPVVDVAREAPRTCGSSPRPARRPTSPAGTSAAAPPARTSRPAATSPAPCPTSGVVCVRVTSRAEPRARARSGRKIASGSALPFTATGSSGSYSNTRSVCRYVCSDTATPSTGAAPCRRDAVFTTSPVTIPSPSSGRAPSATTASPVLIPTRTCNAEAGSASFSSPIASRIRSPARTARSASSSCATGAPNTAITASPMNFSTVPPYRSISSRNRA